MNEKSDFMEVTKMMPTIMGCIMGCVIGLIIGCTHDRVSMSDLSTLTAVGNKVDTKIQNCVWDVR